MPVCSMTVLKHRLSVCRYAVWLYLNTVCQLFLAIRVLWLTVYYLFILVDIFHWKGSIDICVRTSWIVPNNSDYDTDQNNSAFHCTVRQITKSNWIVPLATNLRHKNPNNAAPTFHSVLTVTVTECCLINRLIIESNDIAQKISLIFLSLYKYFSIQKLGNFHCNFYETHHLT